MQTPIQRTDATKTTFSHEPQIGKTRNKVKSKAKNKTNQKEIKRRTET
jgi:hypothetical protein